MAPPGVNARALLGRQATANSAGREVLAAALVLVMVVGSLALWLAVPAGWLWIASHIEGSLQPSMKSFVAIAVGMPTTMIVLFWALRWLDAVHREVRGAGQAKRLAPAWRRSLGDERNPLIPASALDVILVSTAVVAVLAFLAWFFLFAGSSLPAPVN